MFSSIMYETLLFGLKIAGPAIGLTLIVGLVVSVFQALTQIQEQTLTFVPKFLCVILYLWVMSGYIKNSFLEFAHQIFSRIDGGI